MANIRTLIDNELNAEGTLGLVNWLTYVMSYRNAGTTHYRITDNVGVSVTDINTLLTDIPTSNLRYLINPDSSKENLIVCLCDYKFTIESRCFTSALSDYIPYMNTEEPTVLNILFKVNRSDTDRTTMHIRDIMLSSAGPDSVPSVIIP